MKVVKFSVLQWAQLLISIKTKYTQKYEYSSFLWEVDVGISQQFSCWFVPLKTQLNLRRRERILCEL